MLLGWGVSQRIMHRGRDSLCSHVQRWSPGGDCVVTTNSLWVSAWLGLQLVGCQETAPGWCDFESISCPLRLRVVLPVPWLPGSEPLSPAPPFLPWSQPVMDRNWGNHEPKINVSPLSSTWQIFWPSNRKLTSKLFQPQMWPNMPNIGSGGWNRLLFPQRHVEAVIPVIWPGKQVFADKNKKM